MVPAFAPLSLTFDRESWPLSPRKKKKKRGEGGGGKGRGGVVSAPGDVADVNPPLFPEGRVS